GGNLSVWAPILANLTPHGYSVLAFDYRGYGLSTGRPSERGLYRDVDAVLDHAWHDADSRTPIVYWGRSLGTAMAAYAASRGPTGMPRTRSSAARTGASAMARGTLSASGCRLASGQGVASCTRAARATSRWRGAGSVRLQAYVSEGYGKGRSRRPPGVWRLK